jgi:hypothetical protein
VGEVVTLNKLIGPFTYIPLAHQRMQATSAPPSWACPADAGDQGRRRHYTRVVSLVGHVYIPLLVAPVRLYSTVDRPLTCTFGPQELGALLPGSDAARPASD